jgi:transposase
MTCTDLPLPVPTAARPDDSTLFAALELSRKLWLVATSAPSETKISKRTVAAGDGPGLLARLTELREKAERRLGRPVTVVVIQEAGLDGFWLHRFLEAHGIESHVVDAASIAVDRRKRRCKTDAIDVEGLLRTLMAWARGERRVCSMVRPPSPEDEDRRRLSRERETLLAERIRHTNRIKGLLAAQGVIGFEPLRPEHRARLDEMTTGDGRPLPPRLTDEIRRQLARLDVVVTDLKAVEAERDALVAAAKPAVPVETPAAILLRLKGIGPEVASILWLELFFRTFRNRREVAAYRPDDTIR